jgi:hypothetical protein
MNPVTSILPRRSLTRCLLATLGLSFALAMLPAMAQAAGAAGAKSQAEKTLPVTATFEKGASTEAPPYVLKVKNTSGSALKVSAMIQLSVVSHNRDKERKEEQTIEAGKTWTIAELAAQDKVTLKAPGFAPLELVVK